MFSDLSRYQTVRGTDATHAEPKVVQLRMNEINIKRRAENRI